MDKIVTKNQMQAILDSRPKDLKVSDVINAYTLNGYKVEGINYTPETVAPAPQQAPVKPSFNEALIGGQSDTQNQELANMQGADAAIGVAKGVGQTAQGISQVGQKFAENTVGRLMPETAVQNTRVAFKQTPEDIAQANQALEPSNTTQAVAKGAEQIGEFFLPGLTGLKAGATSNFLSKALVEGLGTGMVATAQSGDIKKGAETGLLAGGISAGLGGAKAALNYWGVPEKLYQTIFKSSSADAMEQLNSTNFAKLKVEDPEQYAIYLKEGLIKEGKDGAVNIIESTAKQALDKGYKGSMENMAGMALKDQLKNEVKAREIARGLTQGDGFTVKIPPSIKVPEKEFITVLDDVAERYKGVGFGEIGEQASQLATKFKSGKIDAETALEARRLFDKLRIQSSFDTNAPLSVNQSNFKFMADQLRNRLAEIPQFKQVMKDYAFSIDALESLAKEAARTGNRNVLSLIDTTLLGAASPVGVGTYIGKKLLATPSRLTGIAQSITNKGQTSTTGQALRGVAGEFLNTELNP